MTGPTTFADIVEAAEQLDDESQAELAALLQRRFAARGQARVAATVAEARREFAAGQCQTLSAADILAEAQS